MAEYRQTGHSLKRRTCLQLGAVALGGTLLPGCEPQQAINSSDEPLDVPVFSASRLHAGLDRLLAAYEQKGVAVADTLLPPLEPDALREACGWFPGELPPQLVALYGWRGGQEKDAWETEHPFWFRDMSFSSVARAEQEYASMMASYGLNPLDRGLLKFSFPFASFNGGWYVLPTRGHPFNTSLVCPVICVLEGIDVYFYSLQTMVDTCVDWVIHPAYTEDGSLPRDIELEIWRRHNPGIFVYGS